MPNTKSARRWMVKSVELRDNGRAVKSQLNSVRRKFYEYVAGGDASGGQTSFREYCSLLDKAVKKGVIKANNANRRKSRASARLSALSAA
ncbi:MAG: 30S ribosomal protein S20 [Verrucomicrobia bacterium]|nr:30S ribosomal protein S20 [Verrucomicrobiota bacterium]